jgi:hypothetical protein
MPAVIPILAVTGASAAIGGAAAAAIGLGTVGAVAATAIGTGIVAGGLTALEGGDLSDVLESAVVGGATSYVGGSIGEFLGGGGGAVDAGGSALDAGMDVYGGTGNIGLEGLVSPVEITGTPAPSTNGYYNEITGEFIPDINGPLQGPLTDASGTNYESMDGYFYDSTTDTWITPNNEVVTVNDQGEAINKDGTKNFNIKPSDALRLAALAAGGAGAANLATTFDGKYDLIPIPADWKSPPPTTVAEFTPLAPIDFGNTQMLQGTQWEKLLNPTYNQPAPMANPAVSTNPSNMSFEELTRILGSTKASVPTQNLTINDVIAGIQSQYGQAPKSAMG